MSERYPAHTIEQRWRERWEQSGINRADLDAARRPFYNLMEFPYPSGEGLHVGHVYTYCGADALGRLRRLQGYDVFQPMGFDAFGIHSENYALKIGSHPARVVPANIERFREQQLKRLGCQFDWSREIDTTDPRYYGWTQWIFVQLLRAGLAYQAEAPVNWCPSDQTVLANEQVIAGRCERCDSPIEQRVMRQWFLRISAYADRLLDFSGVDFPEATIKRQREWIGRSEGAEIDFQLADGRQITVFTTRPDTIFGATAIVLAPEHPLAQSLATGERAQEVARYCAQAGRKLERERLIGAEKHGVFSGAYATNPASGEQVPVWVADYVLARYGTGAIMAVPAHDQRDYEFAQRCGLPVVQVIAPPGEGQVALPYVDEGVLLRSGEFSGMGAEQSRRAISDWLERRGRGRASTSYRLRDWLISRQRYWGPPIPVVHCAGCGAQPVPEEQLPVLLPPLENVRPSGSSPLAAAEEFVRTRCPACGGPARRETDVSDNFLDSAWYFLRYTSTECEDRPWDAARIATWLPVDQYAGGHEHTTMHHLYARFLTKALHDLGHLPFDEPFARLRLHGTLTKNGAKISKSRGNSITPDEYMASYGSDVLRMYMLFLGPWESGGDFSDSGISGVERFVGRVWELLARQAGGQPDGQQTALAERRRHRLIARVGEAIELLRFHVAIAALMEEEGFLRQQASTIEPAQWQRCLETLALLLAPLAPHLAEEAWARLGQPYSVHRQTWPAYDPAQLEEQLVELPVQINGKLRGHILVPSGSAEQDVIAAALDSERIRQALGDEQPARVIVVRGRVVNIVL